jgi:hypothetical protein
MTWTFFIFYFYSWTVAKTSVLCMYLLPLEACWNKELMMQNWMYMTETFCSERIKNRSTHMDWESSVVTQVEQDRPSNTTLVMCWEWKVLWLTVIFPVFYTPQWPKHSILQPVKYVCALLPGTTVLQYTVVFFVCVNAFINETVQFFCQGLPEICNSKCLECVSFTDLTCFLLYEKSTSCKLCITVFQFLFVHSTL